ncbi:MAG TPA: hypothetical protein VKE74_17725 [Gemmataceae bacterium]|nr:hypothetical protein [Gemmataceae bacterium]
MIPEDQLRLLTAAVDGELSPKEARRLQRLLAASAEARTLLAQLQAHRECLRQLPKAAPPADLRDRILAKLAQVPPPVTTPATLPFPAGAPTRRRPWVPAAVAASLLLAISAASFGFFSRMDEKSGQPGANSPTARGSVAPALPPEDQHPSTPIVVEPPSGPVARVDNPAIAPAPGPTPTREFVGPPAPSNNPTLNAGPPRPPIPPLETVHVRVPFLVLLTEFEQPDVRQQFADELGRDPAFRIDLFVTDTNRGAEAFQNAARSNGLALFTDAAAQDRIRRKQPGPFMIYTEALTPAELRDLFGKLAAEDAKNSQRVFDSLHATPLHAADQKELRDVLGFDPGVGKRPVAPAAPADPKPISAGTGDQVAKALSNPPGKPADKPAVMLSFSPRINPGMSKELAQYKDRRGERKPSAVPVMIVIRHTSG